MDAGGHRLHRHFAAEERHTRVALAAGGVEALKQQLLAEMRDLYLTPEHEDPPPEQVGPYAYSAVTGPAGGLLSYVRRPWTAPRTCGLGSERTDSGQRRYGLPPQHLQHSHQQQRQQHPQQLAEVLLDRDAVKADAHVAAQMLGLALGDAVGVLKLCPRHRLLAYTLPLADRHDAYVALVRDTRQGRLVLPGGVVGPVSGIELAADGRSLLATQPDAHGRPCKAVLHDLSSAQPPRVLLEEADPRFFLSLGRTKDWAFLLINSNSKTSSEVHLLDAMRPAAASPRLVQRRRPGLEYFVEHHGGPAAAAAAPAAVVTTTASGVAAGGAAATPRPPSGSGSPQRGTWQRPHKRDVGGLDESMDGATRGERTSGSSAAAGGQLIILTNADLTAVGGAWPGPSDAGCTSGGRELTVVAAPVATPGLELWRPLLPDRPGVVVTDMDVFRERVVLYERRNGVPGISVLHLSQHLKGDHDAPWQLGAPSTGVGDKGHGDADVALSQVPLPGWALHLTPGINADPDARVLRVTAASPLHPPVTYDYNLHTGQLTAVAAEAAPPAARALLSQCSIVRLRVPSEGPPGNARGALPGCDPGPAVPPCLVPLTLVLPPGAALPASMPPGVVVDAVITGAGGSGGGSSSSGSAPRDAPAVLLTSSAPSTQLPASATTHSSNRAAPPGGPQQAPRPLLLSVYGAYGLPLELPYEPSMLCMLARGWAVARVHARGGGELGRGWHAAGSRHLKRAVVVDCASAAAALLATGLTAPGLLAGHAVSAGGVALASAMASQPAPWGAAVLRCAFLELLGPSCDAAAPLSAHEWDEWGDPADPQDRAALAALCPYNNLPSVRHPARQSAAAACGDSSDGRGSGGGGYGDCAHVGEWRAAVLASCAFEDPRVFPSIPAKWVARLRSRLLAAAAPAEATTADGGGAAQAAGGAGPGDQVRGPGRDGADDKAPAAQPQRRWLPWPPLRRQRGGERHDESGPGESDGAPLWPAWCCGPLLRVYDDGHGHVRAGGAAAEEAAEEMAFLLCAIPRR